MVYKPKIGIAKILETGSRTDSDFARGPEALESGGLKELLEETGCTLVESKTATLTPEEEEEYGTWHRLGLANRHLAEIVADQRRRGLFTLGLLSNCRALCSNKRNLTDEMIKALIEKRGGHRRELCPSSSRI
jgi:hypothetical protein